MNWFFIFINFIKGYLNLDVICIEVIKGIAGIIKVKFKVLIIAFIGRCFCKLNLKKSVKSLLNQGYNMIV